MSEQISEVSQEPEIKEFETVTEWESKLNLLSEQYESLQLKYLECQKALRESRYKIRSLQQALRKKENMASELKEFKSKKKYIRKLTIDLNKKKRKRNAEGKQNKQFLVEAGKMFTPNQMKLISKIQTRVRWTSEEISQAYTLRFLSKKAYVYVRNELHFPLPGTLHTQNFYIFQYSKMVNLYNKIAFVTFNFCSNLYFRKLGSKY